MDYTEEALVARIAGRSRPSHQPKPQNGKISLLIDIQNNIKAQQSAGFTHWAKLNNLKQAAKTMNFLTEHGISSYGELESKLNAVSARRDTAHAEIKRIESRSAELAIVMKHVGTYRQLKPFYDRYRKSNDKEKFLRGHESEIILFEAAARELKRLGAVPLPTTESMKTELAKADRIENQVIMNMIFVYMSGKYKLILAAQDFFCKLHADFMCLFRRDLSRLKGLDQVTAQVRALVDGMAAGPGKFDIRSFGGTAIGRNKQLSVRLFRVADIVNLCPKRMVRFVVKLKTQVSVCLTMLFHICLKPSIGQIHLVTAIQAEPD